MEDEVSGKEHTGVEVECVVTETNPLPFDEQASKTISPASRPQPTP